MPERLTLKNFIERAKIIHNNKYDYSKVEYINSKTKVIIICKEHGEFLQVPSNHINCKQGCARCAGTKKLNTKEFIEKAKQIHENRYDYSKVNYINATTKVKIICKEHGEFLQEPHNHLQGAKCMACAYKERKMPRKKNTKWFIEQAKKIHGDKYDYSQSVYKGYHSEIVITCLRHGLFLQKVAYHLDGNGCRVCGYEKLHDINAFTQEEFLQRSKEMHGDKYDYSQAVYVNSKTKVVIICKKHGSFMQTAHDHIQGEGCARCFESSGEREIAKYLTKHKIQFIREKTFETCKDKNKLPFDFYLPEKNLLIEFDGIQHFESSKFFGGAKTLKILQYHDAIKNKWADENNIKMLRIKYDENIQNKLIGILQ